MNYNPKIVTSEPPLASMRTMLNTKPTNISNTHSQIRQPAYFVNDNAKRVVGDLYSNTTAASEQFDKLKLRNQNNKKNYYTLQLSNEVADDGSSHRQGTSKYNSYSLTNLEILSKCSRDNDSHDDGDDNRSRQTTHTGDGYFANNNRRRKSRNHLKARTTSISNDTTAKVYQKLGHRRVNESGIVSYKHCPVSELRDALKLGIRCSIESLHPDDTTRDVLLQDFNQISVQEFPAMGTKTSPVHNYRDFTFRAYAPVAFQHFRSKFNIGLNDYLISLCGHDWQELPNAGASGSIFYVTFDDKFIIKTVDAKEANFLLSLLPGYYMNLVQNPETMLPKFFGFYCYQRMDKNIRVVVMNNLVPSDANVTERYDLKGSRYKRKANDKEKQKLTPTLKDLDFLENYPRGILLESFVYDTLISILKRDLRVLRSFEIMDYSLLIAICTPSEGMKPRRSRSLTVHKKSFGKSGRIEDTTTLVADGDAISMSPFTEDGDDQQGITITAPKSDRKFI
ncbi:hypothetical protein GJ496_011711 [Pomphorhynchus laevis]|nr:hypothetical protein GJ496_011711 [Pomphorhynchus laevis]